jgi:hypothetical protein
VLFRICQIVLSGLLITAAVAKLLYMQSVRDTAVQVYGVPAQVSTASVIAILLVEGAVAISTLRARGRSRWPFLGALALSSAFVVTHVVLTHRGDNRSCGCVEVGAWTLPPAAGLVLSVSMFLLSVYLLVGGKDAVNA